MEFGELMLLNVGHNCNFVNSPEFVPLKGYTINTGISGYSPLKNFTISHRRLICVVHWPIDKCSHINITSKLHLLPYGCKELPSRCPLKMSNPACCGLYTSNTC